MNPHSDTPDLSQMQGRNRAPQMPNSTDEPEAERESHAHAADRPNRPRTVATDDARRLGDRMMTSQPVDDAVLRVGVKNVQDGGGGGRLERQLKTIAAQDLDALGIVEAKFWDRDGKRTLHQVENTLGMRGYLVESNHHGCHLVLFIRPESGIRVLEENFDTAPPWWHGLNDLLVEIDGFPGPVNLLLTHLAPSGPATRLQEAQAFGLFRNKTAIAMGDFNAMPVSDPTPSLKGIDAAHADGKLKRGPAEAIEAAGFVDVGAHLGSLEPTVGHMREDRLAYRCDRFYTTLDPDLIKGYRVVIEDGEPDSDHRLVVAEFFRPRRAVLL